MANTNILIKRSLTTSAPSSLRSGELAYSYNSNTIFLGSPTGDGAIKIGGQAYTSQIDAATSAATPNTLVKRDATGNATFENVIVNGFISGTINGVANAAVYLRDSQNFSISGGDITASAVSFNGTSPVTLSASLNNISGLSAGQYGSSTAIPVVTVAANGRVTSITTASITTSFTAAADGGSSQTISGGDTFTIAGGAGITTTAGATDTITIDVDNTVVRSNTALTNQTIDSNVLVTGNLTVQGTQFVTNTVTLNVADPLIYLASNNYSGDILDIGFAGNYYDGTNERHAGFFRNAGDKEFYIFDNYLPELSSNNEIDVANSSFRKANVNAGYAKVTGIVSNGINLDTRIQNIYDSANTNASNITVLGGVNDTQNTNITAVNTYATSAYGQANTSYTRAQAAFDKANAAVFSTSTLTSGRMVVGDGANNVTTVANVTYALTGTLGASKTITGLTVDAYGRVSAATAADIAIASSQVSGLAAIATSGSAADITSGTLVVGRGGTGQTSFTTNGIIFGNSSSGLQVTAAAGTSDQTWSNQILTTTNAGVPVWTTALDGGTF